MAGSSTARTQQLPKRGNTLAKAGTIVCGLAMVIGFLVALAMHWFSDPENPTPVFGKIFAGVVALFCIGIAAIVLGLFLWATDSKPDPKSAQLKSRPAPLHDTSPAEDNADDDEAEGQSDPETKSWDEAFSSPRRRRL